MKVLHIACFCTLVLAIFVSGCTSQPAQTPATSAATAAPVQTAAAPAATPPLSLTSTTWKLGWYDDTNGVWSKVVEGSTITATFLNEGKVTGSGGCNGYSTNFQIGSAPHIYFDRPVVTDRLCQTPTGVMKQESAYFTDLGWAETYTITNGQLLIFDKTDKKILQFDPT